MTRRRTDNRHRRDARGLARRRSNPDAARPQPREQTPAGAPGDRLVDVLLTWMPPDHPLDPDIRSPRPVPMRSRSD